MKDHVNKIPFSLELTEPLFDNVLTHFGLF